MDLGFDLVVSIAKKFAKHVPTKAIEVGYGDYDDDRTPDVLLRFVLQDGSPVEFGPLNLPGVDIGDLAERLGDLLG